MICPKCGLDYAMIAHTINDPPGRDDDDSELDNVPEEPDGEPILYYCYKCSHEWYRYITPETRRVVKQLRLSSKASSRIN